MKETEEKLRIEFRGGLKETEERLRTEFSKGLEDVKERLHNTEEKLRGEFQGGLERVTEEIEFLKKEVFEIKAEIISHRDSTEVKEIKRKKKT